MFNQPHVTLYEFNRLLKESKQEAENTLSYNKQINKRDAFQNALSRKLDYYSFSLPHYLLTDHIVGFFIQPLSYNSSCCLWNDEIAVKINLHYYPPVKYSPIQAPEMIMDLRYVVHKNGQLTYKISNYLADPSLFQANIASILPNGCNVYFNEDGSISIEQLDMTDPGPFDGFQGGNGGYPYNNYTAPSQNGQGQSGKIDWLTPVGGINDGIGGFGAGTGHLEGSFRLSKGGELSPKYYSSNWQGGSKARITTYNAAKWGTRISRGSIVVSAGLHVYNINQAYNQDGGNIGYNTQVATAQAAGNMAGSWAGAEAGVAVGAAIGAWFGGVGAVPGAIIGGIIGGFLGGWGGTELGGAAVEWFY